MWEDLLGAWMRCDWEVVERKALQLREWLGDDGYPPEFVYPKELGAEFNRFVTLAAVEFAYRRAQSITLDSARIPRDVPFVLSCSQCANDGPSTYEEAKTQGWRNVQYVPNGVSENFLGVCPACQAAE